MFNKRMFSRALMTFTMVAFLIGCSSDSNRDPLNPFGEAPDNCNIPTPTPTSNSPVVAGTDILLETPYVSSSAIYFWTGPNGFESHEQNPVIPLASSQTAGTYSVTVGEGDCASTAGTVTVAVSTATSPCNPANNTATNSVYPPMSFYYVSAMVSQGDYEITANGSQGDLTITFSNGNTPVAGLYTVASSCPSSFMESNEVCVSIVTGGTWSDYFRPSSGNVYISYVNGHISATFCDLAFSGTGVGVDFVASAKVTDQ